MREVQTKLYGKIQEPENFLELIELLTFLNVDDRNVHMWRGQSNINWRIDHSAYRRLRLDKNQITDSDLINYEKNLLKQASLKGYRQQNGRILSDLELLAKLQHHGAATRLVDFTRNSLIALWFASSENLESDGLLIGLHTDFLGGYESEIQDYKYPFQLNILDETNHALTFEPPVVTPRVAAQHSQFIYSSLSIKKTGSLKLHPDSEGSNKKPNLFISVKKELKQKINDILEKSFDLRYQTLFPDIDGFGDANSHQISKRKMWRW
ncbi:FRG domain-containing protein [Algibacter sp. L3A6]|uniref:FRG domain-containing protein n=1 Tax=Algibacter sp. L3A6 TaxID=2686366 RepID=UPI00131C86B9|nr:FRG domain-containing protein [Algibacter sp. L3A6]